MKTIDLFIYDSLISDVKKDITVVQKKKLVGDINSYNDHYKITIVYLIIIKFCQMEGLPVIKAPFDIEITNDNIIIELEKLPIKLKRILMNFNEKNKSLNE